MKIQKINELLTFIVLELHIFLYFMHCAHKHLVFTICFVFALQIIMTETQPVFETTLI